MKTLDLILIIMGVVLLIFTITMIVIFCIFQSVPDTLVSAVFSALGAEGGFCAVIQTMKIIKKSEEEKE